MQAARLPARLPSLRLLGSQPGMSVAQRESAGARRVQHTTTGAAEPPTAARANHRGSSRARRNGADTRTQAALTSAGRAESRDGAPPSASSGASRPDVMLEALRIDGALLEGGGQVLRTSMSLAWAVNDRTLLIESIRAGRPKPGLRPQHLASVRLAAALSGHVLTGDAVGSACLTATPMTTAASGPTESELMADAQTAGSVTLMLQAALPPLLFASQHNPLLVLRGGTDVNFSPPAAHASLVLAPLLAQMGVTLECSLTRRGFMPAGGGELRVRAHSAWPMLRPLLLTNCGPLTEIRGLVVGSAGVPADAVAAVAQQVRDALRSLQETGGVPVRIDAEVGADGHRAGAPKNAAQGQKHRRPQQQWCSIQVVAHGQLGGIISSNALQPFPKGESEGGRLAEGVAQAVAALVQCGACVDEHTIDQLVVWMALAQGRSQVLCPPKRMLTSLHLQTAIHFASQLLPAAHFDVRETDGCTLVECNGVGKRVASCAIRTRTA